ncbi:MAG: EAL domain-containing protein, partial [Desulfuromusa sp.]|nr:EAL domain-containing protein [Desulfuromusa sp.]
AIFHPRGHVFHLQSIEVFEPIVYEGSVVGQLMIQVSLTMINHTLVRYVKIGFIGFLIYALLVLLIARRLQRMITDPIHSLVQSMLQISEGKDYSHRVQKQSNDELGSLFDGFNSMLEELERRDLELRKNESHLDYLAYHDPLTNLANRLLFHDRLEHSMVRAKRSISRIAILFIDLDRFKHINDSLGHDAGDRVLCAVAERLQGQVRETDTLARFGGDEFVIILEQLKKTEDLSRFVKKLLKAMEQPIFIAEQKLHVTASIGLSIYPDNGVDADSLMSAADIAMYQAKENGTNTYRFYSEEMNTHSHESLIMENKLRGALSSDQLTLYYQPQFELKTGHLIGFEALIRWNSPDLGFVSPADFIPLAEESGLIVSIGEWVLLTACQTLKELQGHWPVPLRMAVNISPRQFQHDSLVQTVSEALYRSQIEPCCLELELTEGMVMNNVEHAISKMKDLNTMGVQLAIDDFGTGYSSLGYLKKFPISRLKIDQSFVKDLINNSSDQAIVNTVIALGKNMSLEIVAEGIETVEQYDYLKEEGCEQGQGFLMSKPLKKSELVSFLDSAISPHPEVLFQFLQKSKAS